MSKTTQNVSLVIPIYNESGNIRSLVEAIEKIALHQPYQLTEIIFIDDGSTDGSDDAILECAARNDRIRFVQFERNYGQTSAFSAGFHRAKGDIVVCLDGDLQNDPADIPKLLAKLDEGYDVVSGWRHQRQDDWLRSFFSRVANWLIGASTGVRLHDYGCTLKAYRKKYLDKIHLYGEMHRFIPIYMQTVGARIAEMPVNHRARTWGSSKYGLNRTFKVLLDLMVIRFLNKYTSRPIYLFGMAGFFSIFISLISWGYMLYLKFSENVAFILTPLPLMSLLSLFMGILFILLGLLAELLMRVYYESQHKPTYLVRRSFPES